MNRSTLFKLQNMRSLSYSLLALPFLLATSSFAENSDLDKKTNDGSDIVITAEKVTCEKNDNKCVAEVNVKVVQQDEKQPLTSQTLTTDHLTVFFDDNQASKKKTVQSAESVPEDSNPLGSSDIKDILAKGNVKVVRGDLIIMSKSAKYTAKTDIVEFFDNVKIKDGDKAYIESSYASMNKKTGKYEVNTTSKDPKHKKASQKVQIIISQKKSAKN